VQPYATFCQATGFGGTTKRKTIEDKLAEQANLPKEVRARARDRKVVISFNADVAEGLPWRFVPTQKSVRVVPGETTLAFFTTKNKVGPLYKPNPVETHSLKRLVSQHLSLC
jgi:cytochrome c oxidase assembly protein subunit 11